VNDVLLEVGPYAVGSDGTIVYDGNRVQAWVAIGEAQRGEKLRMKVWREGQALELAVPVDVVRANRAEGNQFDVLPRYYVYGGAVFTPLSRDYIRSLDQNRNEPLKARLLYELYYHRIEDLKSARPEPVVLATILPHTVNVGLDIRGLALVDKINGHRID